MTEAVARQWSWHQKLALGAYPPGALALIYAFVHWFMPTLALEGASNFDVLSVALITYAPWVLMPLWGWGLFLLVFFRPAPVPETITHDIPPSFRDRWRGKLTRRLFLTIIFALAASVVPQTMDAGLTNWPLHGGFPLIAGFIAASLLAAYLRSHYARPQPYELVDGRRIERTWRENALYTLDDTAAALAIGGVLVVVIHAVISLW